MIQLTLKQQKYAIISILLIINIILGVISTIYHEQWYIFIIILGSSSLINSINVLLITFSIGIPNLYRKCIHNLYKCFTLTNRHQGSYDVSDVSDSAAASLQKQSKLLYVLPCYNETEKELHNTIESLYNQINVGIHNKLLIIICDGKLPCSNGSNGSGDILYTNEILTNILFKDYITMSMEFKSSYKIWNNKWNDLEIHIGIKNGIKFIIFVKSSNLGKRDSLTLIRRLAHYYNTVAADAATTLDDEIENVDFIQYYNYLSPELLSFVEYCFNDKSDFYNIIDINKCDRDGCIPIEYIIGTDADTVLDKFCVSNLLEEVKLANRGSDGCDGSDDVSNGGNGSNGNVIGVVGFVDIVKSWNPLVVYQYCEYLYAQCLKRYAQSIITKKVSCLSGCVQLIKVCMETCGNDILDEFNRLPVNNENIFNHIRSYASEDRNHICLMFKMYPYVKTIQSMNAIAYTNVPNTFTKFIRQRKRWCAGATCNDLLLIGNSEHNKWERLQSFVNVMIFILTLFVFIATIVFIISIVNYPSYLILILASIMILPAIYSLCIPIFVYDNVNANINASRLINKTYLGVKFHSKLYNMFYYYIGFIIYNTLGSILSLSVYLYTLYYLDDLNWNNKKIKCPDDGSDGSGESDDSGGSGISSLCEFKHTYKCLQFILTYGCSCKYDRSNDDDCNDGANSGNRGGNRGNNNMKKQKSNSSFKINELWDSTEI